MSFALIPAGGQSRRMGRAKLALPLGDRTVLERVILAVRAGGIRDVLVVIGPHVPELIPLAERALAHVLVLPEPTDHMRGTIEAGLRWLEERFQPRPEEPWLLIPGDSPTLEASVVRQLLEAHARHPLWSIVVPTFQGRRGHPLLLAWQHVAALRALPAHQGINSYLQQQLGQILEVAVPSGEILRDLDTPADYQRLQAELTK